MPSIILEERAGDPAPGDINPDHETPAKLSTSSTISASSATLPSTPKKTHAHTAVRPATPPTPHTDDADPFDTDLEAMVVTTDSQNRAARDDTGVWPGKEHWKRKAKEAKRGRRTCVCLASLSRRTRIAVKIAIVLLIVGIAVAVGLGVSKPLGAPIWGD